MSAKDIDRLVELANEFVNDVLPQVGRIVIEDFSKLNELCLLLTDYEKSKK